MSSFLNFRLSAFASLAAALALSRGEAQTVPAGPPPAGPAHTHTPAPGSHAHGTVALDNFVVSATPFARNQVDLAQSTTVLSGRSLALKQQPSIGETLSGEVGMSATSFGPGASRPIIRGLGGDRIRLLENSVGTIDASVTSPDHAVSIEPFLVERIEVVRGPASLLYGSNAVGGVVNVITHRIETDLPTEGLRGLFEVRGNDAANEFARGGVIDFAVKPVPQSAIVAHFDGFRRSTKDVRIPGYAESLRLRAAEAEEAAEHGEPAPPAARGRLPNSALDTESGAAGLSYVSPTLHLGVSYNGMNSNYGVPGHAHDHEEEETTADEAAGVRIDLRQRRTDAQGEWHGSAGWLNGVRFKFGHARYRHAEIEPGGDTGTVFTNKGHDARLELLHGEHAPWTGAFGAQSSRSDFSAAGEEAFLPDSITRSDAVFAFEEVTQGALVWQFGGRFERTRIAAEGADSRAFDEFSGSAGAVWKIGADYALALSAAHTGRAPNTQELFAHGPHAGTQAFEIGDARLRPERSLGLEASLRRRTGLVTGAVTLFTNRFSGYIFEQATGLVAVEHDGEWEFLDPDDEEAHEHGGGLPVFNYVQSSARFWGAEAEAILHLHDENDWQLDLRLIADFTRATERGRNLPRIPAARIGTGVAWAHDHWNAGADYHLVLAQRRTAAREIASGGYALVSAHVGRSIEIGSWHTEVFVRGANLLDVEARPHASFVKELAPLPGRTFTAGLRISF